MINSRLAALILLSTSCVVMAETTRDPEAVFNDYCFSCHGTGWENAPVIGDSFAWEDRKAKGMDVLLKSTIEGLNGMPARGACNDCSEEELKAVIEMLIE